MRRLVALFVLTATASAAVQFDPFLGDHMVLQREQLIVIRGTANPAEVIQVALGNEQVSTTATSTGEWEARFRPRPANKVAVTLKAKAPSGEATLADILIGDVWVCAGQSNMEFPVGREQKENLMESAKSWNDSPSLRILNYSFPGQYISQKALTAEMLSRMNPADFFSGTWQTCTDKSVKQFSAVGWWFGQKIQQTAGVPIGLINWSIGGAPIETFIRREAFTGSPVLENKVKGDWTNNPVIDEWVRGRAKTHFGKAKDPHDSLGINHFYKPGFAWAAGPGRTTWFPVKGWIWYQGESNSLSEPFVKEYPELIKAMVADWRSQWKLPDAPFLWVQLSSIDTKGYKSASWPLFRDNQRKLLSEIPNSGMAVSSDVGAKDDVHPRDKRTVGERLARWALQFTYGKKDVIPSGPLVTGAKAQGDKIVVNFQYSAGLKTWDKAAVREVEVADASGVFTAASATTQGDSLVIVSSVKNPKEVRYGWVPWSQGNLVNGHGLPASTFQIEVK